MRGFYKKVIALLALYGFSLVRQKGSHQTWAKGSHLAVGKKFGIGNPGLILDKTIDVFSAWPKLGQEWGVHAEDRARVAAGHRLSFD